MYLGLNAPRYVEDRKIWKESSTFTSFTLRPYQYSAAFLTLCKTVRILSQPWVMLIFTSLMLVGVRKFWTYTPPARQLLSLRSSKII